VISATSDGLISDRQCQTNVHGNLLVVP
jgi:hypothetical protein